MSRIDPHAPQRRLRFGDYEPTRQPQTPAKRPLNRQISPKNRHIRRTNQYELCKHFAGLYAFRTIRRTGRGVTPVVSQNKKPLLLSCFGRCGSRFAGSSKSAGHDVIVCARLSGLVVLVYARHLLIALNGRTARRDYSRKSSRE